MKTEKKLQIFFSLLPTWVNPCGEIGPLEVTFFTPGQGSSYGCLDFFSNCLSIKMKDHTSALSFTKTGCTGNIADILLQFNLQFYKHAQVAMIFFDLS